VANIQNARAIPGNQHPVQVYLIQAQLAGYRNFRIAQDRLNNHAKVPVNHPARIKANVQLKELDTLLKAQQAGAEGVKVVNDWAYLNALDLP
jgi:uncharacterized SAM-binding protein YcdF (DUF218 family)